MGRLQEGLVLNAMTIRRGWLTLLVLCAIAVPDITESQPKSITLTNEDYVAAFKVGAEYVRALYGDLGGRVGVAEIVRGCGYEKEADEIDEGTGKAFDSRLKQLLDDSVKTNKLGSIGMAFIARDSATAAWMGYRVGFRDAFAATSKGIPSRSYEEMCKRMLQLVKEAAQEGASQ
jgi:hypothetical protein